MKQKMAELKGKINKSTLIVGIFNILLLIIKRIISKLNKEVEDLNKTNQLDVTTSIEHST